MDAPTIQKRALDNSAWGVARRALVIVLLAAALGLAANALREPWRPGETTVRESRVPWVGSDLWFDQARLESARPEEPAGIAPVTQPQRIDLAGAKRLFDEGRALFVDARPAAEFDREHIRGAVSFPDGTFEQRIQGFLQRFPLDRPLVTYCSGEDCMASVNLAGELAGVGYEEIYVFFGGWPEWKKAGYPVGGPWD